MSGKDTGKARNRVVFSLVAAAIIAVGLGAAIYLTTVTDNMAPGPSSDPNDPALVALGREVYDANCASCHGAELQGEPDWKKRKADGTLPAPPHDETGHTWHHPDQILFEIVKKGGQAVAPAGFVSGMPGFGGALSDRDIMASLAYIKSRWPAQVRQRQARMSEQSK